MTRFRHILVPADLSDRSRRAITEGVMLARGSGARLTVLHVSPAAVDAVRRREMLSRLSALVGPRDEHLDLHLDVHEGPPSRELLAFAAAYDVDLIVAGARRRGAMERTLLESVGDTLLREAPCSVLAVPEPQPDDPPTRRVQTVLCAVDLDDSPRPVLETAGAAAGAAGAHLAVLHVIDPWHWPDTGIVDTRTLDETRDAIERSAASRLSAVVARHCAQLLDAECRIAFGLIGPQIVKTAAEADAEMIVIGTHSKRVFGRTYLGHTARYVHETARGPVLLARPVRPASVESSARKTALAGTD